MKKSFENSKRFREERGSLSLEHVLLIGAAMVLAATALPVFFSSVGVYLNGFNEPAITTTGNN